MMGVQNSSQAAHVFECVMQSDADGTLKCRLSSTRILSCIYVTMKLHFMNCMKSLVSLQHMHVVDFCKVD